MARWFLAAAVIGLGVLSASPGAAQTMFLQVPGPCGASPPCLGRQFAVSLDPLGVIAERPVAQDAPPTYVTPEGRFSVGLRGAGSAAAAFVVSDLVTGASFSVPTPGVFDFVGNPTRAEVYAGDPDGVLALSGAGLRRLAAPACGPFGPRATGASADGRRVAFACGNPQTSMLVFDTVSGAITGTLAFTTSITLDPSGTHVYTVSGSPRMLRRIEVATATEVAQVAVNALPSAGIGISVDARTGRVLVASEFATSQLFTAELAYLRDLPLSLTGLWLFDPGRPRAYSVSAKFVGGFGDVYYQFSLQVADSDQWVGISGASSASFGCCAYTVFARPPPVPSGLAASIAGTTVALSWTTAAPAAAVRYLLEAGTAPGLANIATFDVGLQTTLSVGAVPPGTYYIRVRAANHIGTSLPSHEVIVTIP